jgi:hypothetical protein
MLLKKKNSKLITATSTKEILDERIVESKVVDAERD